MKTVTGGGGRKKKGSKGGNKTAKREPNVCFPGKVLITMETGEKRPIQDIRVGDRVIAVNSQYEQVPATVIFVPHPLNFDVHSFFRFTTNRHKNLHMTGLHYIPVIRFHPLLGKDYKKVVSCWEVVVGDRVVTTDGEETVTKIEENVQCNGVYSFTTTEEFLLVDDVVASPYGNDLFSHETYHRLFDVLRMTYNYVPQFNRMPSVTNGILATEAVLSSWMDWFGLNEMREAVAVV